MKMDTPPKLTKPKTRSSNRALSKTDIQALANVCDISRLSVGTSVEIGLKRRKMLGLIQGALGAYYFDDKAMQQGKRHLIAAAKKVQKTRDAISTTLSEIKKLDHKVIDALYDPFFDDDLLLKPLFRLESEFGVNKPADHLVETSASKRVLNDPAIFYRDIIVDLLETLNSVMDRHLKRYMKDARGAESREPEKNLCRRLFTIFDLAYGGPPFIQKGDLTLDDYVERKAIFANRVCMISGIPCPKVGNTEVEMRNPSRLIKAAKQHTKAQVHLMCGFD